MQHLLLIAAGVDMTAYKTATVFVEITGNRLQSECIVVKLVYSLVIESQPCLRTILLSGSIFKNKQSAT